MGKATKKAAAVAAAPSPAKGMVGKKREAEDEIQKAVSAKKTKAAPAKAVVPAKPDAAEAMKQQQPPPKEVESGSSAEDDDEEEGASESEEEGGSTESEEEVAAQTEEAAQPAKEEEKPSMTDAVEEESDGSEGDSDDESEEDAAATTAEKDGGSNEDDGEDNSDEESDGESDEEEEPAETPKDDPGHPAEKQTATKEDETPTGTESQATKSKILFMGNAPFTADVDLVREFFKEAGEVVDVRFPLRPDGRRKPFCYVEFASVEAAQKAVEFNGREFMFRKVKLDLAPEKGTNTPQSNNDQAKNDQGKSSTVYIRGFNKSLDEDKIRSSLKQHFANCGEIKRVSIPANNHDGMVMGIKGIAYIEFENEESASKALELNGSDIDGFELIVEPANPKRDNSGGGGRFGGRRGGRFGGGRGFGGRRGRGRGFANGFGNN